MGFHNVVFPEHLSPGSEVGPGYRTQIIIEDSGAETRNARAVQPRHRYNVRKAVENEDDIGTLLTFFHARRGSLNGFLFRDPYDRSTEPNHRSDPPVTPTNLMDIGAGDGITAKFQLIKVYDDGTYTHTRAITRPQQGTVQVYVGGALKTEGVHYGVNYATGEVTFTAGNIPGLGEQITAAFSFYVPVRFSQEADEWLRLSAETTWANVESIMLEEIPSHVEVPEDRPPGGASVIAVNATIQLNVEDGLMIRCQNSTGVAQILKLPPKDTVAFGGEWFRIHSTNASDANISVRDTDTGTVVATLGVDTNASIYLAKTAAGAKVWVAFT